MPHQRTRGIRMIAALELIVGTVLLAFLVLAIGQDLQQSPGYAKGMGSAMAVFFFGPVSIGLMVAGILLLMRRPAGLRVSTIALGILLLLSLMQIVAFVQTDRRYYTFQLRDYLMMTGVMAVALICGSLIYYLRLSDTRKALEDDSPGR